VSALQVLDRFPEGLSWRPPGEGFMRRSSHALVVGGGVWLVDPVDAAGLDAELVALGEPAGIVITIGRHRRDAESLAERLGIEVWAHDALGDVRIGPRLRRFGDRLPGAPLEWISLPGHRAWSRWREVAFVWPERRLAVVGESVGTAPYFLMDGERVGLHPFRRTSPPTELAGLDVERLLVGHGEGIAAGAGQDLDDLVRRGSARRPALWRMRTGLRALRGA
jgi:hypothetical protein